VNTNPESRSRKNNASNLPVPYSAFQAYLREVNRFPLLTREEEFNLAKKLQTDGDPDAAQKLITANLRFVSKVAYEYKNYNVKIVDLIQEGNIGLMKAIKKFNPDRGYRLISYAVWWIKAYMQNYIIKNWSVVKISARGKHRTLFSKLLKDDDKADTYLLPGRDMEHQDIKLLTNDIKAAARDFSLDATMDDDGKRSYLNLLASGDSNQEELLIDKELRSNVADKIDQILPGLKGKQRYILEHRLLTEEPETLQDIGEKFGISRERVRQIENALKDKLKTLLAEENEG
jgi:RNA polymerase sigma-32 factor